VCHSNTRAWNMQSSPYSSVNNLKVSFTDFFSLTRNLTLTRRYLLQSNIFQLRIRTRLYLKMRPLVLSKVIKLSLVTLWQVRTYSVAVCLSLPSDSCFPSYTVSLIFFCVGPHTHMYVHMYVGRYVCVYVFKMREWSII
jgi:hypothetical protein